MISDADKLPVVGASWSDYENVEVVCPHCDKDNIFNRITDLKTTEPVGGRDLSCLMPDCGRSFRLVSDLVNDPHEMMLFDCERLIERKRYMSCVLTVGQAYEVFFALYLRVELVFKPWAADPDRDDSALNRLLRLLRAKIENHGFNKLRAIVALRVAEAHPPKNVTEAEAAIKGLGADAFGPLSRIDLKSLPDKVTGDLLSSLMATNIGSLRNGVVHKQAYRPTSTRRGEPWTKARNILLPLGSRLDLTTIRTGISDICDRIVNTLTKA
jgi:hypothetical protein